MIILKFGIDMGHNNPYDTGASAYKNEDNLIKQVGEKVIRNLVDLGYTVINCTPKTAVSLNDSLFQRVKAANDNNVDVFVSIHFNSGGGTGTEVYADSTDGRKIGERVVSEISALGYYNRGVKDGKRLYVIRNTNATAILVECAFVDSKQDMDMFDSKSMANAIVKGLTGETIPVQTTQTTTASTGNVNESNTNTDRYTNDQGIKIQNILNRLRIRDSNGNSLAEDGIIGEKTTSALKLFQSIVGINVDGTISKNTLKAFQSILDKPILSIGTNNPKPIRYLQWRTGVTVDGVYGSITIQSIYRFQRNNSLVIDGIVGPKTWAAFIG